ncbi:ABC transporter ATP-binding protein [Salinisphaera orenii]|uniref:ABC transporter ATP-binding protein n=1 Tax=Salinisphaera orenii YIM 95161 TaxID=1051139 RepID=A0A423PUP9_9GAMM|nr:ABC transporter ATP-binding protein [Salinisphaera halophila]ROO29336.1 ABC transporter ATP-binding protein [Salinisphaera halophila YIM 95161]
MTHLLETSNLTKTFGGVHAVADLSFGVEAGAIQAIIGPNGAGKTTLINLLTGIYTPSAGDVRIDGRDTRGLPPHRLAGLGLSRTFQNLQICMNMSALENVMVGRHLRMNRSFTAALLRLPALRRGDADCRRRAAELMDFVGLGDLTERDADTLSYGALKRLEIARALASEPKLLLLDEPAAGLNANETAAIETLIRRVAELGITVILVEHDMKLVMAISDRILVLDHGKQLAIGTPAEVRADPAVISAYLGAA